MIRKSTVKGSSWTHERVEMVRTPGSAYQWRKVTRLMEDPRPYAQMMKRLKAGG